MNRRRLVLILSAVVLALIGTVVVYSYISGADKRALNGVKATTVLIAQKTIPAGTPWSAVKAGGYVKSESIPESSSPADSLTSTSADVPGDQQTTFSIQVGQVVVRSMFAEGGAPAVGSLTIKKDFQAISIALPSNAEVAGYVQPGSQVAVYTTLRLQRPVGAATALGTDQYVSKLLLPRVDVLAVGPSAAGAGTAGSSPGGVLVTVAVNQKDAERVLLAQQIGALYLTLLTSSSATHEGGGTSNFGFFNSSPLFNK